MGFSYKTQKFSLISTILVVLFGIQFVFAAAISSNGTGGGNWSNTATWAGGVVPGAGDDVTILGTDAVTLDLASATVTSLTIDASGSFDPNTNQLTISGALTINGTLNDGTGAGLVQVGGNFTINSGGAFNDNGNGVSIEFNGSGTQTMSGTYGGASLEFYDFTVSGTGVVDNNLSTNIIVNRYLQSAGTFQAGTGTYTLGFSGLINGYVFDKSGGTFTAETSTLKIASSVNIQMRIDANTSFYAITHAPPTGARALTFDALNAATVYTITNALNIDPNSNGVAFSANASMAYSGTTTLNYTTGNDITIGNEWPSTNSPTNITINSAATFTLGSSRTVTGTFTHTGGGVFDVTGGTFQIDGTFAKGTGSFTLNGGSLAYGASGLLRYDATQQAGAEWLSSVPNVTVQSGTVTLASASGNRTITGTLTVNGALTANDNALSTGTFNNNGTVTTTNVAVSSSGNTTFGGSASLDTGGGNFSAGGNLDLGSSAALTTGGGTVSVTGTSNFNTSSTISSSAGAVNLSGDVSMSFESSINTSGTATLDGSLTVSGGATVGQATAGTLVMGGSSTSTVNIDGSLTVFDFTVNKTGGSSTLVVPTSSVEFRFNTNGTLYIQQGILELTASSQFLNTSGVNLSSSDNVTLKIDANGTLKTADVPITGFNVFTLADGSTVEFSGTAAQDIPAATFGNITVSTTHSSGASFTGGVSLLTNSTITVAASSRLNMAGQTITHPGTNSDDLTVASGGTLYTDGTDITGFSTYGSLAGTVVFNGSSQETAPSGTYGNLTVNNSAGLALGGQVTVTGTLTFTNGTIASTSTNTLTLGVSATANPTSTSFVTGPVARQTDGTATSFSFPTGYSTSLRSVSLSFNSAPANSNTITAEAKGTATGATSADPDVKSVEDDGYWTVTSTEVTPPTYTITLTTTNFSPSISASSNVTVVKGTAPNFDTQGTGESSGTDQVTATFADGFSDFAVGNLTTTYTWDGGGTDNNWSTALNWDLDAVPGTGDVISIPGNFTVDYDAGVTTSSYASITLSGSGNTLNFNAAIIDFASTTLTVGSGDKVVFAGATVNNYTASNTTYSSGSTVEFQTGTVQGDDYDALIVNNAGDVSSSAAITVAGAFTKSGGGTFTAGGTFSVAGTTTLSAGTIDPSGGMTLSGNIVGDGGQFSGSSGTVTLNGSSQQTISGTTGLTFNNLTLNNANGLAISTSPTVEGVFTFSNGLVTTGSNNFYIGTAGSISGASSSLYFSGRLAKIYGTGAASFTYPVGKGDEYLPVTLDFSSLTSGYTRVVEVINSDANGLDPDIDATTLSAVSIVRYFEISRVGTGGGINGSVQVTLSYNANDGVDGSATALEVAQLSTDTNGSAAAIGVWQSVGGDGTGLTSGTIQSGTFTSGGDYYALGDDAANGKDNSLPVELSAFEALPDVDRVVINWQTSSELENFGFNIYKKSVDQPEWTQVNDDIIDGRGTFSGETDYSFTDLDVVSGRSYTYKLESVSYNGAVNVEKVVKVDVPVPDEYALFNNYPNPFNPVTNIKFQVKDQAKVTVVIYDVSGRQVKTLLDKKEYAAGRYEVSWDATDNFSRRVASGVYFYRFTANNFTKMGRMVLLK